MDTKSDLDNLLRNSDLAAVFLDDAMHLRWFSPAMSRIYALRPSDVGLAFPEVIDRAVKMPPLPSLCDVYASDKPLEDTVRTPDGTWFIRRVSPYLDNNGTPCGLVVTFYDFLVEPQRKVTAHDPEAHLRRVIDHMLGFVGVLNVDGTLTEANQTALTTGGVAREEVIGKKFWECPWWNYDPEAMQRLQRAVTQAAKGAIVRYDAQIQVSDGSRMTIDFMLVPVSDESGRVVQIIPSGLDISDRKRVERVLADRAKMSELHAELALVLARDASLEQIIQQCCEYFVDHLNAAIAGIWLLDDSRSVLHLKASAGIDGVLRKEQRAVPMGSQAIGTIAAQQEPFATDDVQHDPYFDDLAAVRRAGVVAFAGYPLIVDERVVGVLAFFSHRELALETLLELRPLVDAIAQFIRRKEVQRDLETHLDRMELVTNSLPALIAYIDTDERYEFVNQNYAEQFGYRREEILGKTAREVLGQQTYEQAKPHLRAALAGEPQHYELQIYVPERDVVEIKDVFYSPYQQADGNIAGCHVLIIDTTERRTIEEELRRARAAAESANISKSEFLANMSHEIRTPMSAIMGYAELLSRHLTDPDNLQCVETIRRNGSFLLEIINDILDLSRIEAGKLSLDLQQVRVEEIVAEVVSLMEIRAAEKGLPLEVDFHGRLPETIATDPVRLRQVLLNLVGNAIKFTQQGRVTIVVQFLAEHGAVRFDIVDTGIGVAAEHQAKLFQPFSQADSSVTRQFGGSGLGLSISARLVEMLGGEIGLQSQLGKGSTFWITVATGDISQVPFVDPQTAKPSARPDASAVKQLECRVLVVDDRRDVRYLAQHFLEEAGASVKTANDGLEALEKVVVESDAFDVVLLDMQMPKLDGYQCAAQLRARGFSKPIIALTANAMQGDREKCLRAGCDDYVAKPIDGRTLVATVARYAIPKNDSSPTSQTLSTILIVDDSEQVCRMMKMLLKSPTRQIHVAHSGEAAISLAGELRPDIVLLDLSLPDVSGYDVGRRLREMDETRQCLLIAVSGHAADEDRKQAMALGFDHYLVKPVDLKKLEELVSCRA
ncbi:MAG TPA: response regulator [Pirellulaceae bacterium]|nr:response regulator [Pirellulaceae bacterium]